jgi:hypothetical protein
VPRLPADPAAVARGLAALDLGDIEGAERTSGLHRATLYRARAKRDAASATTGPLHAATPPPMAPPAEGSPAEPAPPWVALASPSDVLRGYGWTAAALIGRRIDARAANALSVLLAGAARVLENPAAAPLKEREAAIRLFLPVEDPLDAPPMTEEPGRLVIEARGACAETTEEEWERLTEENGE